MFLPSRYSGANLTSDGFMSHFISLSLPDLRVSKVLTRRCFPLLKVLLRHRGYFSSWSRVQFDFLYAAEANFDRDDTQSPSFWVIFPSLTQGAPAGHICNVQRTTIVRYLKLALHQLLF